MLTVEQVKEHSEVSIGKDSADDCENFTDAQWEAYNLALSRHEDRPFTLSMARILYVHDGCPNKIRIRCLLNEPIAPSRVLDCSDINETIDWGRFTDWINGYDDLEEYNLVTRKAYSFYHIRWTKQGKMGRNILFDTVRNKIIDCNYYPSIVSQLS